MKKTLLFLLVSIPLFAQRPDAKLEAKLRPLVQNFHGDVGIYVRHLTKNTVVALHADTLFPTASMVKIPITIGLFDKISRGELDYHATLTFRDSLRHNEGEDLLADLRDSTQISLSKVAMLMITTSDNAASLWCQALAGGGTVINQWLAANGFEHTRVNSRTPGRRPDWVRYGWGQTTPREMAELLVRIREGKVISPAASERIYRNLCHIYWDGEALCQLPPTVQAASKQGAVNQSRSEVVLVNAPSGDYVFCVITKNQKDESWERTNEGYELLRAVSRTLWEHFEPKQPYRKAEGWEKW
jgi:beta-lactamase class A